MRKLLKYFTFLPDWFRLYLYANAFYFYTLFVYDIKLSYGVYGGGSAAISSGAEIVVLLFAGSMYSAFIVFSALFILNLVLIRHKKLELDKLIILLTFICFICCFIAYSVTPVSNVLDWILD